MLLKLEYLQNCRWINFFLLWICDGYLHYLKDIWKIFAVWLWEHQLSFLQPTHEHQQHWFHRSQLMLWFFWYFELYFPPIFVNTFYKCIFKFGNKIVQICFSNNSFAHMVYFSAYISYPIFYIRFSIASFPHAFEAN